MALKSPLGRVRPLYDLSLVCVYVSRAPLKLPILLGAQITYWHMVVMVVQGIIKTSIFFIFPFYQCLNHFGLCWLMLIRWLSPLLGPVCIKCHEIVWKVLLCIFKMWSFENKWCKRSLEGKLIYKRNFFIWNCFIVLYCKYCIST